MSCTAADSGIGLAGAADASFTLTTVSVAGTQSASALTGTKNLCDKLGNCVTVGPFSFKIDRQAPTVTITTPAAGATYQPGATVNASFGCADGTGGSGIAPTNGCAGTVANSAPIDTTVGSHTFTVTATDAAGNPTTASVTYSVGYKVCLQYLATTRQPDEFPLTLKLCDSSGANLSSSSIVLKAVYIDSPGTPAPYNHGNSTANRYLFNFKSGAYVYNIDGDNTPVVRSGAHTLYFTVNGAATPVYAAPFTMK